MGRKGTNTVFEVDSTKNIFDDDDEWNEPSEWTEVGTVGKEDFDDIGMIKEEGVMGHEGGYTLHDRNGGV